MSFFRFTVSFSSLDFHFSFSLFNDNSNVFVIFVIVLVIVDEETLLVAECWHFYVLHTVDCIDEAYRADKKSHSISTQSFP